MLDLHGPPHIHELVYLPVCALKGKWLELSTPKSIDILHDRPSACIDAEVKRSRLIRVRLLELRLRLGWVRGVHLHVSVTAHFPSF